MVKIVMEEFTEIDEAFNALDEALEKVDEETLDESINSKVRRGITNSDFNRIMQQINWAANGNFLIPGGFLWFRSSDKSKGDMKAAQVKGFQNNVKAAKKAFSEKKIQDAIKGGLKSVKLNEIRLENPKYFAELNKRAQDIIKNPLADEYTKKTHVIRHYFELGLKMQTLSAANFFKYSMSDGTSSKGNLSAKEVNQEFAKIDNAAKVASANASSFKTIYKGFETAVAKVKKAKASGKISTKEQDYAIANINDARNMFFQATLGFSTYQLAIVRVSMKNLNRIYGAAKKAAK